MGHLVRVGKMTSASISWLYEARARRGPRRRPTTARRSQVVVSYFTIGILLLIETIKIDYNFKRIIYVIGGVMYASGMIASLCAMRQMHTTDPHVLLAYSEKLQE